MNTPVAGKPTLSLAHVSSGYGDAQVLEAVDLEVGRGEVVALMGRNGAGKSTLLSTVAGLVPLRGGTISFDGRPCIGPAHRRARAGLAYVLEERGVLLGLTALENLRLGQGSVDAAVSYFPEIAAHLQRPAGLLSGGQQQMLAVSRALAARPSLLMIDELSLGLAPQFVERLLRAVREARSEGISVLLVEQHARTALSIADRAYVLDHGRVVLTGSGAELTAQIEDVERAYMGGV